MNFVTRALSSVTEFYKEINPATLSGAIDVIVVEQPDGELSCTPFHVRFGKLRLLRPQDKVVEVRLNGELTDFQMKLGDKGEAFFVVESEVRIARRKPVPAEYTTSPIARPVYVDDEPDFLDLEADSGFRLGEDGYPDDGDDDQGTREQTGAAEYTKHQRSSSDGVIDPHLHTSGELILDTRGYHNREEGELEGREEKRRRPSRPIFSVYDAAVALKAGRGAFDTEIEYRDHNVSESPDQWSWGWGKLPGKSGADEWDDGKDAVKRVPPPRRRPMAYAKTLRLTSEQLKKLDLKRGTNTVSFKVATGNAQCSAKLYYWHHDIKLVVSDIDGTITKSDALGHIFNMVGKDWTHPGVAKLYTDIVRNGYHMMYLTSRAIGQADSTRDYLRSVEQGSYQLPDGPVVMSPDRLFTSFHREVILRKPEVFKMACLRDIKRLFGDEDPFYAGFGNRITDALSYRSVNVPVSRIFTIDSRGDLRRELLTGFLSSYITLNDIVDQIFPPV
ncbi:Lipin/Ned1/Smp2-domain-containing protein, partial [Thamnocephalis sphaerospora]